MNTISPTIKYTFTYSRQTVTFLDAQIYLSETRKFKAKLYRKPTDCMALLHFHSHHPLSCKEGIIYSQALRYNMIIPEDHILQAELNNLTRILLARAYPLHLIIKNIKKALTHSRNYLLSQRTPHTETNILPIITPFSNMSRQFTATIHRNWHIVVNNITLSTIWPSKPLSAYTKSNSIHNHLVHSAQTYGSSQKVPRTTTHTHPHTPIRTYPHITTVVTPVSSSIRETPNSSWCHGQWIERQDIPWRSSYHPTTMRHTNAPTLMLIIWEVQSRIFNVNIFSSNNITLHNL